MPNKTAKHAAFVVCVIGNMAMAATRVFVPCILHALDISQQRAFARQSACFLRLDFGTKH